MLEAPQPPGAKQSGAEPAVAVTQITGADPMAAMKPIIDQALELVAPMRPQPIPTSYAHVASRAPATSC
jgi:hypothetical protein